MIRDPKKDFLKRSEKLQMTIVKDDGVFRHLSFRDPEHNHGWFTVTTFPGHLVVVGDYGSYVFARVEDMFEFFRGGADTDPGYCASKALAEDVEEDRRCWVYDWDKLREEVSTDFYDYITYDNRPEDETQKEDWEMELYDFLDQCEYEEGYLSTDSTELDDSGFVYERTNYNPYSMSYSYLWTHAAVSWAVEQYDKEKDKKDA